MSCAICEGPIPNALEEGDYVGAVTKFHDGYNDYELCSPCGNAEGMAWRFGEKKHLMIKAIEDKDWDAWKNCVLSYLSNLRGGE